MDRFINSVGVATQATSSAVSAQIGGIVLTVSAILVVFYLLAAALLIFGRKPQAEESTDLVTTYRHVPAARKITRAPRISWLPTHRPTMVAAE